MFTPVGTLQGSFIGGGGQHVAQTALMLSLPQSGFCVRREKVGVLEAVGQLWETPEKEDSP